MNRANPATLICAIAFAVFLALAILFLGGRQYKAAFGMLILSLASLAFGIGELRHAQRDAQLKREPFTTDFPPQRKHDIR